MVRTLSEALAAAMSQIEMTAPKTLMFRGRLAVTKALVSRLIAEADAGERDPEVLHMIALSWAGTHFRPAFESRAPEAMKEETASNVR
jgi:hypothetical protein